VPQSPADVELTPEQPQPVAEQVAQALATGPQEPDPWLQAGLEEQLEQ
jgi:hypothetical protein